MMTLLGIQSHAGMLVYCSIFIRKPLVSAPYHPLRSGRGQPREEGNRVLHWHRAVE